MLYFLCQGLKDRLLRRSHNPQLHQLHQAGTVGAVDVAVCQEFQAFQEALDLPDQQVVRDHQAIRDLKGPRDQWVHKEAKVTQGIRESKAHQVPRVLLEPWEETGSSASTATSITDWTLG